MIHKDEIKRTTGGISCAGRQHRRFSSHLQPGGCGRAAGSCCVESLLWARHCCLRWSCCFSAGRGAAASWMQHLLLHLRWVVHKWKPPTSAPPQTPPPTGSVHACECWLGNRILCLMTECPSAPPLPTTSTSVADKHDRCVSEFAFDLLSCFSLSGIRACIITCGCFRLPFFFGYFKHFQQSSLLGI